MGGLFGNKPKKTKTLSPSEGATRTPSQLGTAEPGSFVGRVARRAVQGTVGQIGAAGSDDVVIPIPDEDELERVRRRRAARRTGGRNSTVLSDDDGLGG